MPVNKVVMNTENGAQTLIDLTRDSVTPETLAEGATAHDASGERIVGTMPTSVVLYTAQTLTEAQQAQARENIGVGEEYRAQLVQDILDAIGCPVFGVVDENNNIILTGALPDATYSVKYEDEDGSTIDIGELVLGEEIINQIPLSTDTDGTVYNGVGYKTPARISSSGAVKNDIAGVSCTGFIPVKKGDKVYMKDMYVAGDTTGYTQIRPYASNKSTAFNLIAPAKYTAEGNGIYSYTITDDAAFIRVAVYKIMDGSEIITINQPIV